MRAGGYLKRLCMISLLAAVLMLAGCSGENETETETEPEPVRDMAAETIADLDYGAYNTEGWDNALSENEISKDFSEALGRFSFQLAGSMLHETGENQLFSPLSIYYSLAVTDTGAGDGTRNELNALLHMRDADELSDQCRKLMLALSYGQQMYRMQAAAKGITGYESDIYLADSLWFSKTLTVNEEFQENAARNFFAPSFAVNFENPDSQARMEYWIREMTDDAIYPRINLPSDTLLALVNTLYLYGAWETPFDPEATVEDVFTLEDGVNTVGASYCCRTDPQGKITAGEGYQLSSLKTANGCEMVILLPESGRSVDEFLQTPDELRTIMERTPDTDCSLTWKIPKFSFGSSYSLPDTLRKFGVTGMFTQKADLHGISDMDLYVSDVLHSAHISLDENGVEGAAYTIITMNETALLPEQEKYEMICDHPFIFGIREQNTGVWLVLGVLRNSAAE